MKKLTLIILTALLLIAGCNCIAQLPTQYLYVDEACTAQLPDYLTIVSVSDNCSEVSLTQTPAAFAYISIHTDVTITATDQSGNINNSTFTVMLLDTIPPALWFTDDIAYNIDQIKDVYYTWLGWALNGIQDFQNNFDYEEFGLDPNDPNMRCFRHVFCTDHFETQ